MVGHSRSMRVQIGDPAVPHRHVQVGAQQHALARDVQPVERAEAIGRHRLPNSAAVSAMRLEKPHSLSYQPITRAIAPSTTAVCVASKRAGGGAVVEIDADQLRVL